MPRDAVPLILGFAFLIAIHLIPRRCDQLFYAFDASLGFEPSFNLGRLIYGSGLLINLVATFYFAWGIPAALLWATQRRNRYSL
jgi:hypothetical protein